jgi:hypothetical protein
VHESADARRHHDPASGYTDQDAAPKPARLNATVPLCEELIVKERDAFVVTNLLDSKVSGEILLQEVQRRPLQPGEEIGTRQQHSSCARLIAAKYGFMNVFDLSVGEPVQIVEDEQRGGGRRTFQFARHTATPGWPREHPGGVLQFIARQIGPARDADHRMARRRHVAEGPGEDLQVCWRIASHKDEAAIAAQCGDNAAGEILVVDLCRKIVRAGLCPDESVGGKRRGRLDHGAPGVKREEPETMGGR